MTHDNLPPEPYTWVGAPTPRRSPMNPLNTIPTTIRVALYWTGYVLGVLGQGITLVWAAVAAASPTVAMPLWLVIAAAIIGLLTTQLNLLAGSNVVDTQTVTVTAPTDAPTTIRTEIHGGEGGRFTFTRAWILIAIAFVVTVALVVYFNP